MPFAFDPEKSERNRLQRSLPFEEIERLDWANAYIVEDDRRNYGEPRFRVFGRIKGRLHIAIVTPRGEDIRVISLRKANRKEERIYDRETQ